MDGFPLLDSRFFFTLVFLSSNTTFWQSLVERYDIEVELLRLEELGGDGGGGEEEDDEVERGYVYPLILWGVELYKR